MARYPDKKAGITLANTFPTLWPSGRETKPEWEEGIVVGMSGDGVTPISNLTLAKVAHLGVAVSGNGGPMDYKAAAHFLALGARTVQFCTVVMKYGYGVFDDLHRPELADGASGASASMDELIGIALPLPDHRLHGALAGEEDLQPRRELCLQLRQLPPLPLPGDRA